MSPQAQRIAIAELCGWREAFPSNGMPHPRTKEGGILLPYHWINENTGARLYDLPDYPNDLNAMHEAEKVLTPNSRYKYALWLGPLITDRAFSVIHATAAQRAEAFLKTLGKWEDGQ